MQLSQSHLALLGAMCLVSASIQAPLTAQVGAPDRDQSRYWESPVAVAIPTTTVVHQETVTLTQAGSIYAQSDGNFEPNSWPTSARCDVWLTIDGAPVSNTAIIEWNRSVAPQVHSYNVIGSKAVAAGSHTIRLLANAPRGTVTLGAKSNLLVFVNPADTIVQVQSTQDSPDLEFTVRTGGVERCTWGNVTHHEVARLKLNDPELPVFTFGSARLYRVKSAGDAMLGIFFEESTPHSESRTNFQSQFGVDDMWLGAEYQGPVYVQGILTGSPPTSEYEANLILGATEFPLSIHPSVPLNFRVGSQATLTAMYGGLQVKGWAGNNLGSICDAACIGGSGSGCPPMKTETIISKANINVPAGHDGRIMFNGKCRIQGDSQDGAVRITMKLRLDGQIVGSEGIQGLAGWLGGWDTTLSQRTLCTSYLTTGAGVLSPGPHTIELLVSAEALTTPARTDRVSIWDDAPFILWVD